MTFHYNGRMSNIRLSPEQWTRILDFLRGRTGLYVGQEADCRRFVEAVLWINRSGAQWRPASYGNWNSVTNDSPVGLSGHTSNLKDFQRIVLDSWQYLRHWDTVMWIAHSFLPPQYPPNTRTSTSDRSNSGGLTFF